MFDATIWAFIGLVIFLGIIAYLKVPGMIAKALDGRAEKISNQLEEARRLREEAQELLAEYQRKRTEAEKEAESIVDAAKREAANYAAEAKAKTDEFVNRRTAMAEQKIAQAETDAVNQVRASAVDVAIDAAQKLMGSKVTAAKADQLFKSSLADIKANLS